MGCKLLTHPSKAKVLRQRNDSIHLKWAALPICNSMRPSCLLVAKDRAHEYLGLLHNTWQQNHESEHILCGGVNPKRPYVRPINICLTPSEHDLKDEKCSAMYGRDSKPAGTYMWVQQHPELTLWLLWKHFFPTHIEWPSSHGCSSEPTCLIYFSMKRRKLPAQASQRFLPAPSPQRGLLRRGPTSSLIDLFGLLTL